MCPVSGSGGPEIDHLLTTDLQYASVTWVSEHSCIPTRNRTPCGVEGGQKVGIVAETSHKALLVRHD